MSKSYPSSQIVKPEQYSIPPIFFWKIAVIELYLLFSYKKLQYFFHKVLIRNKSSSQKTASSFQNPYFSDRSFFSKNTFCKWLPFELEKSFVSEKLLQFFLWVMAKGFNNISVISWWKPEYPEKTTDLLRVTDKLHYIMYFLSNQK